LVITGAITGVICIFLSRFVAKVLGRSDFEKRSLAYIFAFANTGFFGYPVVEAVFGQQTLGRFIIFCIPLSIMINSYGYNLFASEKGFDPKKLFLSPTFLSTVLGCVLGLTGWRLPSVLNSTMVVAGGCMSSAAMLLTGLVLGSFSIKNLLCHLRPYGYNLIQLVAKPLLGFGVLYLLKLAGLPSELFFFAGVFLCLPVGLNCVVFPESFGHHAEDNAKTCFISFLMSVITLPVLFSLLKTLSGVG
jgi:predicted permease